MGALREHLKDLRKQERERRKDHNKNEKERQKDFNKHLKEVRKDHNKDNRKGDSYGYGRGYGYGKRETEEEEEDHSVDKRSAEPGNEENKALREHLKDLRKQERERRKDHNK